MSTLCIKDTLCIVHGENVQHILPVLHAIGMILMPKAHVSRYKKVFCHPRCTYSGIDYRLTPALATLSPWGDIKSNTRVLLLGKILNQIKHCPIKRWFIWWHGKATMLCGQSLGAEKWEKRDSIHIDSNPLRNGERQLHATSTSHWVIFKEGSVGYYFHEIETKTRQHALPRYIRNVPFSKRISR